MINFKLVILVIFCISVQGKTCPRISLDNGRVRIKQRDQFAIFKCFRPYTLFGRFEIERLKRKRRF